MDFEELMLNFALPVVVMACIVMVLTGIVKIFTKMIPDKESKLYKVMGHLYVVLVPCIAFGVTCAYYGIFNLPFDWLEVGKTGLATWTCSQALYPIYRDLGGRTVLLKLLSAFKGKSKRTDEIITLIENIIVLNDKQKDAIKEEINEKL